jgi:hypothetical protein
MSIFLGDPQISIGYYIWKSMIPALLGNIVGGSLMVGTMYWYLNLTGESPVLIDGVGFGVGNEQIEGQAVESGSPASRKSSSQDKKDAVDLV